MHDDRLRSFGAGGDKPYLDANLLRQKVRHSDARWWEGNSSPSFPTVELFQPGKRRVDRFDATQVLRDCGQRFAHVFPSSL